MWRIILVGLICAAPVTAGAQQRNLAAGPVQIQIPGERPVKLYSESYALVIGASAYNNGWPRLAGVPGDIRAVAAALREQRFRVTEVLNPTLAQLETALRKFIGERGQNPDNRILIYYAGHGYTLKSAAGGQLGYIVPVDAPLPQKNIGAFKLAAMSMEVIESYAKQIDAKHALFVFDSCFSGTFFKMRAAPESITLKTTNPVRQFITAGSADQEVPDVSVFRQQFIAGIKGEADLNGDGYVTGSELGMFLEDKVTNYSRQTQTPQYGKIRDPNLDKGDFVFALASAPRPVARTPSAPVDAAAVEVEVWNSVKDSGSVEEINAYLEQYPKGQFALVARARAKALGAVAVPTAAPAAAAPRPQVALAAPTSVALPRPGASFRDCDVCPEMVSIPAGSFMMGSPGAVRYSWEAPQHQVTIARPFAAGKYEVTFDEWDACVHENGCSYNPSDAGLGHGRRPVINVTWEHAKQYVEWLSRKTGKTYRLLSEAEWEYVARAGSTTAFSWGDSITPQQANYDASASYAGSPTGTMEGKTVEVGRYAPNAFGLHDVHGNVWEWVEDCGNAGYAGAPSDGSAWTSGSCGGRILRGGSWLSNPQDLRSARRDLGGPLRRGSDLGLRVARTN